MLIKNVVVIVIMFFIVIFGHNIAFSDNTETTAQEKQEYEQDYARVADVSDSLSRREGENLDAYEAFADSIDQKWQGGKEGYYARLMLEICRPFNSRAFSEYGKRRELARKYALSALEKPDSISLKLELELIGYAMTDNFGPAAPSGDDFTQRRVKDTAVRLHAWKRLLGAIDPNWNLDQITWVGSVKPPATTGLPAGVDPEAIKDLALRAEYKEAIRLNNEKREKHQEQYDNYRWLKRFPKRAERYIINAYSTPPFAIEELRKMLNDQLPDQAAKARIIAAVEKNMRESPNGTR